MEFKIQYPSFPNYYTKKSVTTHIVSKMQIISMFELDALQTKNTTQDRAQFH